MINRPTITLIVEDNIDDIDLIKFALREQKFQNKIYTIRDGSSALEFLHKRGEYSDAPTPDLILLDMVLPKLSGTEVLKQIKTDDKLKSIPVIIFATADTEKTITEAYEHHANAYITKPIDFEKFSFQLKRLQNFWFKTASLPPKEEE